MSDQYNTPPADPGPRADDYLEEGRADYHDPNHPDAGNQAGQGHVLSDTPDAAFDGQHAGQDHVLENTPDPAFDEVRADRVEDVNYADPGPHDGDYLTEDTIPSGSPGPGLPDDVAEDVPPATGNPGPNPGDDNLWEFDPIDVDQALGGNPGPEEDLA